MIYILYNQGLSQEDLAFDLRMYIADVKLTKKLQKDCKLFTGSVTLTLENKEVSPCQTLNDKKSYFKESTSFIFS